MTVFQYLDRWYTVSSGKLRRTRTGDQSKLLPGQTLKEAAQRIKDDPSWTAEYEGGQPAPAAAPPPQVSNAPALARAPSINTGENLRELSEWIEGCAEEWLAGSAPTPTQLSHGHSLIYRTCAESSAPANAEQKVYEFYVDCVRRIVTEVDPSLHKKIMKPLQT